MGTQGARNGIAVTHRATPALAEVSGCEFSLVVTRSAAREQHCQSPPGIGVLVICMNIGATLVLTLVGRNPARWTGLGKRHGALSLCCQRRRYRKNRPPTENT